MTEPKLLVSLLPYEYSFLDELRNITLKGDVICASIQNYYQAATSDQA